MKTYKIILVLLILMLAKTLSAFNNKEQSYISNYSDFMQFAPSIYALALVLSLDDKQQFYNFSSSLALNVGATQLLKFTVQRKRPKYSFRDRKDSFPSGHTSFAFQGAFFVHSRYGLELALPAYLMAGSVGLSRILLQRHFPSDVLAGILIAYVSNAFIMEKTINNTKVLFMPSFGYEDSTAKINLQIVF